MRASIHFTDFDRRYFPDVSTDEDTNTGIDDDPKDSRAMSMRTLVLMFVTVVKSGKAKPLLNMLRDMYGPIYAELKARADEESKLQ